MTTEPGLAFHASPPGGWINDPVGLVRERAGYALFTQHRGDAPDFKRVGWARFTSPDLLRWRFDGVAIPPTATHSIYSGCVSGRGQMLEAFHTLHNDAGGLESQCRRVSRDGGRSWNEGAEIIGSRINRRDPFLIAMGGSPRRLLLAEPCSWENWDPTKPSRLAVFEEKEAGWRRAASLGPYASPGVLLEMPALLRQAAGDVLLLSLVDRRGGGAASSVRALVGRWNGTDFAIDPGTPATGALLDLGPDFYAAIPTGVPGLVVGWLASWQTARRIPWPGFSGGPISLPRRVQLRRRGAQVVLTVAPPLPLCRRFCVDAGTDAPLAGLGTAAIDGRASFRLRITTKMAELQVDGDWAAGTVSVRREGADWLAWEAVHHDVLARSPARTLRLFLDGPATELFIGPEGRSVTAAVPGAERRVTLEVGGKQVPFAFVCLPEMENAAGARRAGGV